MAANAVEFHSSSLLTMSGSRAPANHPQKIMRALPKHPKDLAPQIPDSTGGRYGVTILTE
jgi:hypothetical protein